MKNFNFNENKNKNNNNNNEKLFNWEEQAKLDSQQSFREQQKHMIDNLRNDNNNRFDNRNDNNRFDNKNDDNRLDNRNDDNRFDNRNDNNRFDNKDNKKIKRDNNQNNFR